MPRPTPNRIVAKLSDTIPFIAPAELERQGGFTFLARLGANESVFGPSSMAIEAMKRAAENPQWYGDPLSHDLRQELASKHGLTQDHFVVGSGIDGMFGHIASAFLEPNDAVVTTLGSYPTFNYFIDAVGAQLIQVPYDQTEVNLKQLALAAIESNAKAVYIANPDNPSGHFHPKPAIEEFLKALRENILVILDEAYVDFEEPYEITDPRLIRLRTFSKAYGLAGTRVAYAMGDPETIQPLNRIRPHFEVNLVAQAGALASLRDKDFIPNIRKRNTQAKQHLEIQFAWSEHKHQLRPRERRYQRAGRRNRPHAPREKNFHPKTWPTSPRPLHPHHRRQSTRPRSIVQSSQRNSPIELARGNLATGNFHAAQ